MRDNERKLEIIEGEIIEGGYKKKINRFREVI